MNLCGRMSRGQCKTKTQSTSTPLGRCNNRSNNNVIIVDVDGSKIDVIIVDTPESSNQRSRYFGASLKLNKRCSPSNVISIDDEGIGDVECRDGDQNATSRKIHNPSSKEYFSEDSDSDECQVLGGKGEIHSESPKWMFDNHSSECSTSVSDVPESGSSETDTTSSDSDSDSDCEIMDDSSGNFREEWEKAASKKKMERSHPLSKEGLGAFGLHDECRIPMCETAQEKVDLTSTSGYTHTAQKKDEPNASASINGNEDPVHVPDVVDGFTEESSLKFRWKFSVDDLDHIVGASAQNSDGPLPENLHRTQFQPEFSFDHKLKSHSSDQDVPFPRHFSCDKQMQHGLHDQSGGFSSAHESVSLFAAEILDKHQEENVLGDGYTPCNNHCPSQHVAEPQSTKATDAVKDISSFHPQAESASSKPNIRRSETCSDVIVDHSFGEDGAIFQETLGNLIQEDINSEMFDRPNLENVNMIENQNDIIGEWEKHKESEEYRLAEEKEWASRRRQLQIQAEEVQKLRKRKKAENLRLLEMEKRQKQRVEEMRESQKRDEEAINLKDQLRVEIRKELEKLEMKYKDMASLLRGLGISVGGGLYPMSHEVNLAYKQALLRFHPDRASRTDIRQLVEAEEKFKLISRLKEKLLPIAY
uniref:J domain-containing protein n=1 Tax=Anthurium amnicola TaxID=1678845 RepID=A0A1D1XUW4_9ARAE